MRPDDETQVDASTETQAENPATEGEGEVAVEAPQDEQAAPEQESQDTVSDTAASDTAEANSEAAENKASE
jgi:hypothetical protein